MLSDVKNYGRKCRIQLQYRLGLEVKYVSWIPRLQGTGLRLEMVRKTSEKNLLSKNWGLSAMEMFSYVCTLLTLILEEVWGKLLVYSIGNSRVFSFSMVTSHWRVMSTVYTGHTARLESTVEKPCSPSCSGCSPIFLPILILHKTQMTVFCWVAQQYHSTTRSFIWYVFWPHAFRNYWQALRNLLAPCSLSPSRASWHRRGNQLHL